MRRAVVFVRHSNPVAAVAIGTLAGLFAACGSTAAPRTLPDGREAAQRPARRPAGSLSLGGESGKQAPQRRLSSEIERDFAQAVAVLEKRAKDGWSEADCRAVAKRFADLAAENNKLVEARYNAGLAYQFCQRYDDAEDQYHKVLQVQPNHARTLSNLGEIYWVRGSAKSAEEHWKRAVEADRKLVAARNNLASLLITELRQTNNKRRWNELEKEARTHLSSVLAVEQDNVKAYVLYGLLYMEGSDENKNRLDLAGLLLEEAKKREEKYAPLYNAKGLLYMRRGNLGLALKNFERAVHLDPAFWEARMNVGNITLGFRKYDTAAEQFSAVLAARPQDYDALIGLGVAQRGRAGDKQMQAQDSSWEAKQLDAAEETYKKAIQVDSRRGEAYFNLGVLYKDFRANKSADLAGSRDAYEQARGYFRQFLSKAGASREASAEADHNIKDCDKIIRQLEEVMRAATTSS